MLDTLIVIVLYVAEPSQLTYDWHYKDGWLFMKNNTT